MLPGQPCCQQPSIICQFAALKGETGRQKVMQLKRILDEASDEQLEEFASGLHDLALLEKEGGCVRSSCTTASQENSRFCGADIDSPSLQAAAADNPQPARAQDNCTSTSRHECKEVAIESQEETDRQGLVAQEETCTGSKTAPWVVAVAGQSLLMSSSGQLGLLREMTPMLVAASFDYTAKELSLHVITGSQITNASIPHHEAGRIEVGIQIYSSIFFCVESYHTWKAVVHGDETDSTYHSIRRCQPDSIHGKLSYKLMSDFDFEKDILKATVQVYSCQQHGRTLGQLPLAIGQTGSTDRPLGTE